MAKVNKHANDEHHALANYKLLSSALPVAGLEQPIDPMLLSKGQPQATLDLLHLLYSISKGKELAPLDTNVVDTRGGKRRAAVPTAAPSSKRAANGADETVGASPPSTAPPPPPPPPQEPTGVEIVLRDQLAASRAEVSASRAEALSLAEERDFYLAKLERIEDACQACASGDVARIVQRILVADEDELRSMAAA
jgi:hypothetical protein